MIDFFFRWIAALGWRRKIERDAKLFAELEALRPGDCHYCRYTLWAAGQGVPLKIRPHNCRAGNGGPKAMPAARVIRRTP